MKLYVAEFAGGLIKVGATRIPDRRRIELASQFRRDTGTAYGLRRFVECGSIEDHGWHKAERRMIARVARLATWRRTPQSEWFAGISFEQAVHMAKQSVHAEAACPREGPSRDRG